MKAAIIICVCLFGVVSSLEYTGPPVTAPAPPKVSTKELWTKVKSIFQSLKTKLTDPDNVQEAQDTTEEQLQTAAEAFQDAMEGIGSNILAFSAKNNMQVDGQLVKDELFQLGQCGQAAISQIAQPMSEVVGILTKKGITAAQGVNLPADAPKQLVQQIKEAAPNVVVDPKP